MASTHPLAGHHNAPSIKPYLETAKVCEAPGPRFLRLLLIADAAFDTNVARKVRFNHGVIPNIADIGAAWQNGYAERLILTIKEEKVDLSEYRDYHDVYQSIGRFLEGVYMHKRIHSSLGYLTPVEFKAQWLHSVQADHPG